VPVIILRRTEVLRRRREVVVDTSELPPQDALRIHSMVRHLETRQRQSSSTPTCPEGSEESVVYELVVRSGDHAKELRFTERSLDPQLRAVIDFLLRGPQP
jgi:hypothetical protein